MLKKNSLNKSFTYICLALLLNSISIATFTDIARAEGNNKSSRKGLPVRRMGGGTRSSCNTNGDSPLTAIVPENSIGLTSQSSPKLFFYIPATNQPQQIEFVLRDPNDALVYETTFDTQGKSGIINLALPTSTKSNLLKVNGDYHWYLSAICNPQNRSQDTVVEGWIRRVDLKSNLSKQVDGLELSEQIKLYQKNDLWYDALNTLAEAKKSQNDREILTQWEKMLKSVGLNNLSQKPFLN